MVAELETFNPVLAGGVGLYSHRIAVPGVHGDLTTEGVDLEPLATVRGHVVSILRRRGESDGDGQSEEHVSRPFS